MFSIKTWVNRSQKFFRLDGQKQRRLFFSILLVALINSCMRLTGFATLKKLISSFRRRIKSASKPINDGLLNEAVWALELASRLTPGCNTCLIRALALNIWLLHHGTEADLQIGVIPQPNNSLLAHAWIVVPNHKIIWESTYEQYNELTKLSFD